MAEALGMIEARGFTAMVEEMIRDVPPIEYWDDLQAIK